MSSIFSSVLTGSLSVGLYLLCLLFAGLCGQSQRCPCRAIAA